MTDFILYFVLTIKSVDGGR